MRNRRELRLITLRPLTPTLSTEYRGEGQIIHYNNDKLTSDGLECLYAHSNSRAAASGVIGAARAGSSPLGYSIRVACRAGTSPTHTKAALRRHGGVPRVFRLVHRTHNTETNARTSQCPQLGRAKNYGSASKLKKSQWFAIRPLLRTPRLPGWVRSSSRDRRARPAKPKRKLTCQDPPNSYHFTKSNDSEMACRAASMTRPSSFILR